MRVNGCMLWLLALALPAQEPIVRDPMSAAELRTTLEFLTDDERGGRDTPSLGLTQARDYLVERVRASGLQSGAGTEFVHRYTLPGVRVHGDQLEVSVRGTAADAKPTRLRVGDDVRVWRADAEFIHADVEVVRVAFGQPGVDRMLQRQQGRRPVLVEVDADSPLWVACAGVRERLSRGGGAGGAPWLLVRKGVLPEGSLRAEVKLPAPTPVDIVLHNVVATLPAADAKEWIVFSAHYDHVGIGAPLGGDVIYNGADDNATGSAAVLALAEAFAAQRPRLTRNLAFLWFSAEEKGLRGSRAFVEQPTIPLADIAAVVNLEMLGRPPVEGPKHAWFTGSDLSDLAAIAEPVMAKAGIKLVSFAMSGQLFQASDNYPFADKGVVAHSLSAGSLHEDYHQPGDELARLDLDHMSEVVRGLFALGVELATRSERPAWNAKGQRRLKR